MVRRVNYGVFSNHTVHQINSCHYSQAQIDAWAPEDLDPRIWFSKVQEINPYVAVLNGKIVGYADLQKSGYIDHFFCHYMYQSKGVGSYLISFIVTEALRLGIAELSADVSITAKPFFESKGFVVLKEQVNHLRGQELINYKMVCKLD